MNGGKNMTIIYKHIEFTTNSGIRMFAEQYADKPLFAKFWRYGTLEGHIWSDTLLARPNIKRITENY